MVNGSEMLIVEAGSYSNLVHFAQLRESIFVKSMNPQLPPAMVDL